MRTVWALHGFGGCAEDWEPFRSHVQSLGFELRAIDVYELVERSDSYFEFAELVRDEVRAVDGEHHVLGYSLGGRLALSGLVYAPGLFNSAVIVSANPGLSSKKEERLLADRRWATRFRNDNWSSLWAAWNAQPTLATSDAVVRSEPMYDRELLSKCLEVFSLAHQEDYRAALQELSIPICWVTGSNDSKFTAIAREIEGPLLHFEEVPGAGHRVPWDSQEAFKGVLSRFWTNSVLS